MTKETIILLELETARARLCANGNHLSVDVATALAHIRDHLFDPELNVESLRRDCRLRNHNLTTTFRAHFGEGIRTFIENHRLETAMQLLRYSDLEIWRIARAVGFTSPETFCRAFRRKTGTTPSHHRQIVARRPSRSSAPAPAIYDRAP